MSSAMIQPATSMASMASTTSRAASTSTDATLVAPPRAVVHDVSASNVRAYSIIDGFFGYTLSGTRDSRHDSRVDDVHVDDELPAYDAEAAQPPKYSRTYEHPTLARMLFFFGFVFFPAWIMGAFILNSPLTMPPPEEDGTPSWLPEKTDAERQELLHEMRHVEVKWAKRCLYALLGLVVLIAAVVVTVWAALHA